MEKAEGRAILKRLQKIVNMRGDLEAKQVVEELRAELDAIEPREREEKAGRDRKHRGGFDR